MSKGSCFRAPFSSQRVNGSQALLKSALHHFYLIFPLIRDERSWKKLLLVRSEILGLFVNTLTADEKYSRYNREKFPQQIQMQLYKKPKTFSRLFIVFLKSTCQRKKILVKTVRHHFYPIFLSI